jgi:glycosyltransferase involved in cell wall biosynthesis
MHILLVADGRSPITRRWLQAVLALQHRVTLVSTYPCEPLPDIEAQHVLPVAFAQYAGSQVKASGSQVNAGGSAPSPTASKRSYNRLRAALIGLRYQLAPLTLPAYERELRKIVEAAQPDLMHALRIPFEGLLAAGSQTSVPLAVSIWGNDLTLHANRSALMGNLTRQTLRRANGLLADAARDLRLAGQWGFQPGRPALVLPGGAGIDLIEMQRLIQADTNDLLISLPQDRPLVLNPRGFRPGSVRTDVFFQAIPRVIQQRPEVLFACAGMDGQPEALRWVAQFDIAENVRLLPYLSQPQLWHLFHRAAASVSVSEHDGTPNSLLEAMALGCLPIAGDIESIREWITPGVNGLLVEPSDPQALAEAILLALDQPDLRPRAAERNLEIIRQRAEVGYVRGKMADFYESLAG